MTLEELLEVADEDLKFEVRSNNQPVSLLPGDPRLKCGVLRFGIVGEFSLWIDIDEEVH